VSQEWYYSIDGDRQGPISGAELRKLAEAGTLKATDLVWKDGMADWVPAKSIKGLFGAAAPSGSKTAEQAAARSRPATDEADDRPARARRRDDEDEEDDRPRRRRDGDEEDRPVRARRGAEDDDEEDDDRAVRRRDEDEVDDDEDRPRKKKRRVPEDVGSKKMVAGILGILLGGLGIHKFYLGMTTAGLIMLLVSVLTCGAGWTVMHVIGVVEGIMYLIKPDEDFYQEYIVDQKAWF
jgi:TM2 domain-containing membrane protein YozV